MYVGSFRGNKRDGYGEMTWGASKSDAEWFKGLWHADRRFKGKQRLADGTEYDGDWRDDAMHGAGRLTFKSEIKGIPGTVFQGRFENGVQAPTGTLYLSNGDVYQGEVQ